MTVSAVCFNYDSSWSPIKQNMLVNIFTDLFPQGLEGTPLSVKMLDITLLSPVYMFVPVL